RAPAIPDESFSHEEPAERAGVAQRAGAFLHPDVDIEPAAWCPSVRDEVEDRALAEPDRRAHHAGAAEDGWIPEVRIKAQQPAHRRPEDHRLVATLPRAEETIDARLERVVEEREIATGVPPPGTPTGNRTYSRNPPPA